MNDLRAQLAPGWSPVNIALTVVLFFIAWPLGLLMIAYIVWGRGLGLDFSRPETLSAFGGRLGRAWGGAKDAWRGGASANGAGTTGGTPIPPTDDERARLERERRAFEAEKRDWQTRRERESRGETLDS